jgi:hypothetical protein
MFPPQTFSSKRRSRWRTRDEPVRAGNSIPALSSKNLKASASIPLRVRTARGRMRPVPTAVGVVPWALGVPFSLLDAEFQPQPGFRHAQARPDEARSAAQPPDHPGRRDTAWWIHGAGADLSDSVSIVMLVMRIVMRKSASPMKPRNERPAILPDSAG